MTLAVPIKIMIVDDHAMLREGIHYLCLTASDLSLVVEAANGEDALALCYKLQPDLVLLDLMMPGMDSIATIKAMRKQFPEVKILTLPKTTYRSILSITSIICRSFSRSLLIVR